LETILLNGQSLLSLYRFALSDSLLIGNPKTSAKGWVGVFSLFILQI
jgi:hypothetical protein